MTGPGGASSLRREGGGRAARLLALLALALALPADVAPSAARASGDAGTRPVTTVSKVDLGRYAGLWYEVAKIPNRFQKQCARGTSAEYTLRSDGRITVVNRCFEAGGDPSEAKGVAKIVDTTTCAKLEVSFVSFLGWRPFWGDYWIIGLDDDYEWAAVGTPDRKYGWILARAPALDAATQEEIFAILERNGYRREAFVASPP